MKTALIVFATLAFTAIAAPPGKVLNVDANWQQLQALEPLSFQQGASARLLVKPKLAGVSIDLTGITARWEARPTIQTNAALQALSVYTSNTAHTVAIDLSSTQTGTPVTNWVYSVILISGGQDYPLGTGRVDIVASGFTGGAAVLVNNGTAVLTNDVPYLAAITGLVSGANVTLARTGRVVTVASTGGTGDLSKATADLTYAPISVSVSGVTSNYAVTIPGGGTNWLAITNGLIKSIQSSDVWQLVSNGTFAAGVSGWTTNVGSGGAWTFDGSTAVLTGPAGVPRTGTLTQSISSLSAGRTYRATFTCTLSATGGVKIYVGGTAGTNRGTGTWTEDIVAGASGDIYLWPNAIGPGDTATIDNVTLYDVTP